MPQYVVEIRTSKTVKYLVEHDKEPESLDEIKDKIQYLHNSDSESRERDFSLDKLESIKEWEPKTDGCTCYGWYHQTDCPNWVMTL